MVNYLGNPTTDVKVADTLEFITPQEPSVTYRKTAGQELIITLKHTIRNDHGGTYAYFMAPAFDGQGTALPTTQDGRISALIF